MYFSGQIVGFHYWVGSFRSQRELLIVLPTYFIWLLQQMKIIVAEFEHYNSKKYGPVYN